MRIFATPVKCGELKPGDLFSTAGQWYWDTYDPDTVGQRVYIRTDKPCPPDQAEGTIYRVRIRSEGESTA